jgi:hypothetical protein
MFSSTEILNMDVRDLAFWLRAAKRKILLDQIRHIQAVRAGMAEQDGYMRSVNELQDQVRFIDEETDIVQRNWQDLRESVRGLA